MPRIHEMMESKFLKKEEVGEDGTVVTVASVQQENAAGRDEVPELKWTITFNEFEKSMVLNSTNIKMASNIFGEDDTDHWTGKKLIAYNDPNIQYAGKITGGIRFRSFRKAAAPREVDPVRHAASKAMPGVTEDDFHQRADFE